MAGFHPLVLVLGLEVESQEVLGELDVLREAPDADTPETRCRLAVLGTARRVDVTEHLGNRLLRTGDQYLVLFRRLEGADWIVDGDAFAGVEATVVAGVVPRKHLGIHRFC